MRNPTLPLKNVLSNRFILAVFLLSSNISFSQNAGTRIDIGKISIREHEKILKPTFKSNDTLVRIAFIVYPEVDVNSYLRVLETKGKFLLEVLMTDKNIHTELFKRIYEERDITKPSSLMRTIEMHVREKMDTTPLPIKTRLFSIPISNTFANKMIDVFSKVKALKSEEIRLYNNGILFTEKFDFFDGSTYEFLINTNSKLEGFNILVGERNVYNTDPIQSADFIYQVKLENVRIINDALKGQFKESNYTIYK